MIAVTAVDELISLSRTSTSDLALSSKLLILNGRATNSARGDIIRDEPKAAFSSELPTVCVCAIRMGNIYKQVGH